MNWTSLHRFGLTGLLTMGLGLPAWAQDAGRLDKETAEQAFRRPAYSPPDAVTSFARALTVCTAERSSPSTST